jgi:hypothetical protein
MRLTALSAVLSACLLFGGCGLVFLPMRQKFPEPVAAVRVVDASTGEDIESAEVTFEVCDHQGDKHLPPRLLDAKAPATKPAQGPQPRQGGSRKELAVSRGREGAFTFEAFEAVVWAQWLFPLSSGNDFWKLHDCEGRIRAAAPGHAPLVFQYAALRPPVPGWSERAGNGRADVDAHGVLWFHLEKRGRGPE